MVDDVLRKCFYFLIELNFFLFFFFLKKHGKDRLISQVSNLCLGRLMKLVSKGVNLFLYKITSSFFNIIIFNSFFHSLHVQHFHLQFLLKNVNLLTSLSNLGITWTLTVPNWGCTEGVSHLRISSFSLFTAFIDCIAVNWEDHITNN